MTLPYEVRVHARARHVRLRVDARQGLIVTVPPRFDQRRIPALLIERREWIDTTRRRQAALRASCDAALLGPCPERIELAAMGRQWSVHYREASRVHPRLLADEQALVVEFSSSHGQDPDAAGAVLRRWLAGQARAFLGSEVARLARHHGLGFRDVTIRRQRSRWGSCSAQGRLSLNVRLMFCPPRACRYVLIHELAHTEHPDHSPAFWAKVAELMPDYRAARAELGVAWQRLPDWA